MNEQKELKEKEPSKKLGFGLMRLPKKWLRTDSKQFCEMVDTFMANGFTYFDTAFVYGSSEADTAKALVKRYPRQSYQLASKLNTMIFARNEKTAKEQFYKSLERTGAGYFDYYLAHAIMTNNYKKYERYGIFDFMRERKEEGLIKNIGFSFHAGPELLDQILTEHPEVDFVQLQINYADWENPRVQSRANYEVARKYNKPVIVMEPVKGGKLANPPKEVRELFDSYNPDASYASWAIRFAASLEGVKVVLSGMSSNEQMKDNISYMKEFKPLNQEEQEIIQKAQRLIGKSATIDCTSCHYCTKECPKEIPIPEIFSLYNNAIGSGQKEKSIEEYQKLTKRHSSASECIECRQCERICPQHLPVTDYLKKNVELFEN